MGSDQSHHAGSGEFPPMSPTQGREGAISPRQDSVCSDSEVPYVSYTVNKPIGDSPKKKSSTYKYRFTSPGLSKRSVSMESKRKSVHDTLVVVNKPEVGQQQLDPELARLKDIPSFLPIMRASLTSSGTAMIKDPDILERLDYRGLYALCQRYQNHLRFAAGVVSTEQAELCKRVRDVDEKIEKVTTVMSDRQKKYNKHADKIKDVNEMSKILNKCHVLLNENIEQIEVLNNMLPREDRLEPFVWTTG